MVRSWSDSSKILSNSYSSYIGKVKASFFSNPSLMFRSISPIIDMHRSNLLFYDCGEYVQEQSVHSLHFPSLQILPWTLIYGNRLIDCQAIIFQCPTKLTNQREFVPSGFK